jgi:hypothetical protein
MNKPNITELFDVMAKFQATSQRANSEHRIGSQAWKQAWTNAQTEFKEDLAHLGIMDAFDWTEK